MGLKVLHLIDSGGLYGAEKMLLALVKQQLQQGLTPMILSAGEPGIVEKPFEVEAQQLSLPVIQWRMKPGFNIIESLRIIKWAREKNVDLIHTHGFKFNFLMGILPKTVRYMPQIVTLHGHVPAPLFSKMWLYQAVDYLVLSRTAKIVIVNEEMRGFPLIRALPKFKIAHISNGIEAHSAAKSLLPPKIADFISKHHINIVAIGRLSPEKGFNFLIEALASQKIEFKSIGVCILGEGSLQPYLQKCIEREKLEGQVLLGGYVSDADNLLHHFNALVMPSLTEGLPITVLEAMRAGVPVIASAVGGIPYALDHGRCGILLEPGNIRSLAQGLKETIHNQKKLDSLAQQAKERFIAFFTSKAMADAYLHTYMSLIDSHIKVN